MAKLGIVEEELDETLYWLELLVDAGFPVEEEARPLSREGEELLRITVASSRTAKRTPSR